MIKSLMGTYGQAAIKVVSSKVLIAAIVFATTPIISRLYTPSEYGKFAIYNSVLVPILLLTTLSIPQAIVVELGKPVRKIIFLILQLSIVIGIFLVSLAYFFQETWQHYLGKEGIILVLLIPVILFIYSLTDIFASLNIRNKEFSRNIAVNFSDVVSIKSASIFLGYLGIQLGLIFAEIFGRIINLGVQLFYGKFTRADFKEVLNGISRNNLAELGKFRDYPKYYLPSQVINRVSGQTVIWILATFLLISEIGVYTMAISLLRIPINIIALGLQPVITRRLGENVVKRNVFVQLVLFLMIGSLIIYGSIYLLADAVIPLYLGEKWYASIRYVEIFSMPFCITLITTSLASVLVVYKKHKLNLKLTWGVSVFVLSVLLACVLLKVSIENLVIVYAITLTIAEIVRLAVIFFSNKLNSVQ